MLEDAGAEVEIEPGRTGAFEIVRDGEPVFSKLDEGRFPEESEIAGYASGN